MHVQYAHAQLLDRAAIRREEGGSTRVRKHTSERIKCLNLSDAQNYLDSGAPTHHVVPVLAWNRIPELENETQEKEDRLS